MITLDDNLVQVEIIVTEEAMIPAAREKIEASGGKYQGHYQTLSGPGTTVTQTFEVTGGGKSSGGSFDKDKRKVD